MRSRATLLMVLALVMGALIAAAPPAGASDDAILAQQPTEDPAAEGGEGQDAEGEGQSDPDAETGANEEQTEDAATPETTGPPWTYQMARITLALLVVLALGLAYLYYRLVAQRRRGEV